MFDRLAKVLCAAALAILLSACGGGSDEDDGPQRGSELPHCQKNPPACA